MPDAPHFFMVLAWVGFLAAIAMIVRAKSQGPRMYIMAAAFIAFGLANLSVYFAWPDATTWVLGGLLLLLLLVDVAIRSAKKGT
jgi:hypothetical protein